MQKVQAGHDVVSLFNVISKPKQFNPENVGALAKIILVVGAFLIVIVGSLALNFISQRLEARTKVARAEFSEPAAFEPSQAVSELLSKGYLGQ